MTAVEIRNLHKSFGNVMALDGFDLKVESGAFAVVLGASGSGKTTLLRLIAGLDDVDDGDVLLDGDRINDVPPHRRDIAMVFQQDGLLPHLTVFENIEFPLRMQRKPSREMRQQVEKMAGLLGIEDLATRRPDELSGGQRQRVALGRALVRHPRLFLLDEPLGQLDTPLRAELRDELRRLQRELRVTTLLVTHDQSEAMEMADQLIILDQHRCVQHGSPLEVYDQPATPEVGAFLGAPPMNFLNCQWDKSRVIVGGVTFDSSGVEGQPTLVGIRPERLALHQELDFHWSARVESITNLGFDSIVHLSVGGAPLKLRIAGEAGVTTGERVTVGVRADDLRWFHPPVG